MTGIEIRPPQLTGGTPQEQLGQLQRYLTALAQQLQFAFDAVQGGSPEMVAAAAAPPLPPQQQEQQRQETLRQLKTLILKSAQVTQVLEQQVGKRLEGKYVAVSQFGTYCQETSQTLEANSRELRQTFQNVQQLESTVAGLGSAVREVNASIRTGEIADGVYGVEIGQQEREDGIIRFRRYARLTAEKLSFYDSNEIEVAYISNRRLYVTAAEIAEVSAGQLSVPHIQMGEYTWQVGQDGHLSLR